MILLCCVVYFVMNMEQIMGWIFGAVIGSGIVYGISYQIYEKFFVKEEKAIELPQDMKEDE